MVFGALWTTFAPVSFQTSRAGDADVQVVGARVLADQERAGVEHDVLGAHRAADPFDGAFGLDDRALGVEVVDVLRPVLHGRVARLGAFLDEDLDDGAVHRVDAVALRGAALDVVDLGALVGDDQRVLEGALGRAFHAEVGLEREVDLRRPSARTGTSRRTRSRRAARRTCCPAAGRTCFMKYSLDELRVLLHGGVHRAEDDSEVRVLLLEPLVEGLLSPDADDAGEVLALCLRDAELLEGVLLLLRDVVPAVELAGVRRGVEDQRRRGRGPRGPRPRSGSACARRCRGS